MGRPIAEPSCEKTAILNCQSQTYLTGHSSRTRLMEHDTQSRRPLAIMRSIDGRIQSSGELDSRAGVGLCLGRCQIVCAQLQESQLRQGRIKVETGGGVDKAPEQVLALVRQSGGHIAIER